jgi:outer membrane protein OmpA-like peptidoglycan-associated protein
MNNPIIKLMFYLVLITCPYTIKSQINFLELPFEDLVSKARDENKFVFIFLSNNNNESFWMHHNVFTDSNIAKIYNENFVSGLFYGQINYADFRRERLSIKNYPALIFYHPQLEKGYQIEGGYNIEQVLTLGEYVSGEFKLQNVMLHQINLGKEAVYKIPNNDGRYTLGVKGKRIMYGYPYPNSTSHFILNANGKMASNSPRFLLGRDIEITDYLEKKSFLKRIFSSLFKKRMKNKKIKLEAYDNVKYLNDTLLVRFDKSNALHSEITYHFDGLKIDQKLSPLNADLMPCKPDDSTRYYQADYIIENTRNVPVNAGLLVLFDTMVDDNDAAKMDAFKTDLLEHLTPDQRKEAARMRGKYEIYLKQDGLKRILVYHNQKLAKGLTSDFRFVTDPDEIHIGSWPRFYSVLWDMPKDLKPGEKYFDSAVLLKWNPQPIAPGDKVYFSCIYGLYNKGKLELIPSGTNYSGTDTSGTRVKLTPPELVAVPDTIYEGGESTLYWKVVNPLNAQVFISAKPKSKQQNKGSLKVKPDFSTVYYLQMIDNGKEVASANAKVTVLKKPEEPKISLDGRFTVGIDKQAITFGFPFPYSTSHFQLTYNKKQFSNSKDDVKSMYLPAWQRKNPSGDERNSITYQGGEFELTQNLVSLDKTLKSTDWDNAAFLRCEYHIKNTTKNKANIVFRQILDFSSFISDSTTLKVNGLSSRFNRIYKGERLPKELSILGRTTQTGINIKALVPGIQKPSSLVVGDWHFLKNMEVKTNFTDTNFYQSPAVLFSWAKTLNPGEVGKFAFIIGASNHSKLKYLYNEAEEISSTIVHFETNRASVSKNAEKEITDFIKRHEFDFIVLEGFTDNRGSLQKNHELAGKRIEFVRNILTRNLKIANELILKKVHGEVYSNLKSNYTDVDDLEERKVKISLFRAQK